MKDDEGDTTMDFGLDEAQQGLQDAVRRYAADRLAPRYQEGDRTGELHADLLKELSSVGLVGLRTPEEFGGQGADCVTTGIAFEEIGRADINVGYVMLNAALVSEILLRGGTTEQHERWLPPIADGRVVPALCLTEPDHGSDAANLELRADRDGDGWRLTGEKTSITLGDICDTLLVFARTGDPGARGITAFYVAMDRDHITTSRFSDLGNHSIGRSTVYFDGLIVDDSCRVGEVGEGFVRVMSGFDYSRALIGLLTIGSAQAAIDDALQYSREREAFGQPIGKFQGVSFPLVEYATYLRGARHVCYEALWRKDQGLDHAIEANMAKWWAPKIAVEAIHQALLTFGHMGYSDEVAQEQRLRDTIGLEIGDGTAQIAKLVVARHMLGRQYAP